MKNLPTAALLIFFLGFILASSSYAKVLPIIEGSELLDTLASQSNEELQMPALTAGLFKHMIHYVDKYPLEKLKYDGKSISYYSISEDFKNNWDSQGLSIPVNAPYYWTLESKRHRHCIWH